MTWFRARLRWAVMADGGEGLRRWEEADCFFRSVDWDAAFARAEARSVEVFGYELPQDLRQAAARASASVRRNAAFSVRHAAC